MNLIDRQNTGFLKFIGQLPAQENYIPVESLNRGAWYWVDKNTPYLQIISPVSHPWGQKWVISPVIDRGTKPGFLTKNEKIGVKNCQNLYCTSILAV